MSRNHMTSKDLLREAKRISEEATELKEQGKKDLALERYRDKLALMCTATLMDRRGIGWYYRAGVVTVQPRSHNLRSRDPHTSAPLRALKSYINSNGFLDEDRKALDRRVAAVARPPRRQKRPGRQLHHRFS